MSKAAMTRSASASASARTTSEVIPGISTQNYVAQAVAAIARSRATPIRAFETILALEFTELKTYLDTASSNELRALRAHNGFRCAGTKEINKS